MARYEWPSCNMPAGYTPGGGRCCGTCGGSFKEWGDNRTKNYYCNIGFIGKHLPMSRQRKVEMFDVCDRWESSSGKVEGGM
jgi:hypothetical protein